MEAQSTLERLSKSDIGDLALDSALQLERARSGRRIDTKPLHTLAAALRHSAGADDEAGSIAAMWPGYFDPFERLYRSRTSAEPKSLEQIRRFISDAVKEIDAVKEGHALDGEVASRLIDFCIELNEELGRRQWLETRVDDSRRSDPVEAFVR